jgi:DNA-binding PadR family transcriptional regulator
MLTFAILGLLRDGRLTHGYELSKRYRGLSGIGVASGSFYRQLGRMVVDGLIRISSPAPDEDARRMPYQITDHGIGTFDTWLTKQLPDDDLVTRGLFLGLLQPSTRDDVLHTWEAHIETLRESIEVGRAKLLAQSSEDAVRVLPLLHDRRLRILRADLEFLRALRRAYSTRRPRSLAGRDARTTGDASAAGPSAAA